MNTVTAWAPGSVSNVSSGFDVLGFAIEEPGDRVTATREDATGVRITEVRGDDGRLPRGAEENTAGVAARQLLARRGDPFGVSLILEKGMPLASGLGSSAASAVAALVAVDALFESPTPREVLLRCAMEGERIACGTGHADNVAPSLYGGFVLVRGRGESVRVDSLPVPPELWCAVVHPHLEVPTREARSKLPDRVALADAVAQAGNVAALVAGLAVGDTELLASGIEDRFAEPVRTDAVPGFAAAKAAAGDAGACGCGLSGSGPTMFAFAPDRSAAEHVAVAMREALARAGAGDGTDLWISRVGVPGARVL
ncbi:MAG: homoserine kinase [bacterium]